MTKKKVKMHYFGHMRRTYLSLKEGITLGITTGARKKAKHRMRWVEDVKSVTGPSVNDIKQLVKIKRSGVH